MRKLVFLLTLVSVLALGIGMTVKAASDKEEFRISKEQYCLMEEEYLKEVRDILLEKGCILSKTPVFVVAVPDEPAGLSKVLELLAEKNVDIEYMYSLFTHQNGKAFMVFRLADEEGFKSVIEAHGLDLISGEELNLK